MKKLYDGECSNSDCGLAGERAEFWAEGVGEDGKLVDAVCEECHGRVAHALSPVGIRRHGDGHGEHGCVVARLKDVRDGMVRVELDLEGSHGVDCEASKMVNRINSGRARVNPGGSGLFLGADAKPVALRLAVEEVGDVAGKPTLH